MKTLLLSPLKIKFMKKVFFCLFTAIISLNTIKAQSNIYFEEDTIEAVFTLEDGPLLSTDSIKMTNQNEDTIVVDWLLDVVVPKAEYPGGSGNYQDAWSIQVCDELLCYGPIFQAQTEIPPQEVYTWKLNISGSGIVGYELMPGEGIATFEAIDTVNREQIASFSIKIKVEDTSISIENFYEDKISVYPSPANEFVNINILENEAIQQLSISNLSGADLIAKQINFGNTHQTININQQASGLYLLVFKDENGKPLYQKLLNKK